MSAAAEYDAVAHGRLLSSALEIARHEKAWSAVFYTPLFFNNFNLYECELGSDVIALDKFTQWMALTDPPNWSTKLNYDLRRAATSGVQVTQEVTRP